MTAQACSVPAEMERAMTPTPHGGVTRLALVALALTATLSLASAHGPAEWIQRGGYKNAAGELCCGERDCFELASSDVRVTAARHFVHLSHYTAPFQHARAAVN